MGGKRREVRMWIVEGDDPDLIEKPVFRCRETFPRRLLISNALAARPAAPAKGRERKTKEWPDLFSETSLESLQPSATVTAARAESICVMVTAS